nr:serine hydrolase [uncultured Sphingosinicella sp.]
MRRRLLAWLLLMVGSLAATPATAQAPAKRSPFAVKAEALTDLFNGKTEPAALFSPSFLGQVPAAQVKAISEQLRSQFGLAKAVNRIEAAGPGSGTVFVDFERATLQVSLSVEPTPPHLIQGLLIVGSEVKGDSLSRIVEELKALPGRTSLAIARLGNSAPAMLIGHEAQRPMAVGSAFKLFLLAQLDLSIRAGERRWTDVIPLTHRSLPSGFLQDWPAGSALTLHSLAALMISQSDNSATDTLLHALGRERVEAMMAVTGVRAPERNRPFLSTMEAFALKGGDPEFARSWAGADEAGRRTLLGRIAGTTVEKIDVARLNARPNLIDSVEWFLSAEDLVRTLDWIRRNGSKETLAILAINPGLARPAAARFAYVGYKGGSETGVIAMSYLVQERKGAWYAVAGSWNNPVKKVEEDRFALLMARAVSLLPRSDAP